MHYADTSVLMAYLVIEPYSAQAEAALRDPAHSPLAVSAWTETELVSAFGIKCRTKQIDEADMEKGLEKYEALRGFFVHLQVQHEDYRNAATLLRDWRVGLRAGDALHLALAQRHSCVMLSLDKRLVKAGLQAGIAGICLR
ncbi:type II toxin-antitoxin system VapC family toxin [uncultured Thiodictyon sp.]|jgi:predicted nucleic acid-binding protein|uniref:type II toxin-antitoxin system VapC family toxin n=1 Tax=uncultured Thiodictyon sp. TaxID=1846217 RepID=UPI0025E9BCB4|nr:type II toxin-antitoxin system VapC family toxin [uncultured Thiodictyon sp.]